MKTTYFFSFYYEICETHYWICGTHVLRMQSDVYVGHAFEIKMWSSSFVSTTASYFSRIWSPVSQKLMLLLGHFITVQMLGQ
jgi:hypothetical protein